MNEETTPRDLLARAERVGAARGLRGVQRNRVRSGRVERVHGAYALAWVLPVLIYAVLVAVAGWVPAIGMLLVGMVAMYLLVSMVRSPGVFVSLAVVAAAEVVVAMLAPAMTPSGEVITGAVALVAYVLPVTAFMGVQATARSPYGRWMWVLLGSLSAPVSLVLSVLSAPVAVLVGIGWALVVCFLAGGGAAWARMMRARLRSGVVVRAPRRALRAATDLGGSMDDVNIEAGVEGELRTAAHLLDLPSTWTVLHSRDVPGSNADIDHLAVGPAGVFLIDTKDWTGTIASKVQALEGENGPYEAAVPVMDGRLDRLPERLGPTLFEAARVAEALLIEPDAVRVVVAFTDRTNLPDGPQVLHLSDVVDEPTDTVRSVMVHLMAARDVPVWLQAQPPVAWSRRSLVGRWWDRTRGGVTPERQAARDERYMRDMGALADYVLPPRG